MLSPAKNHHELIKNGLYIFLTILGLPYIKYCVWFDA